MIPDAYSNAQGVPGRRSPWRATRRRVGRALAASVAVAPLQQACGSMLPGEPGAGGAPGASPASSGSQP